MSNDTYSYGDPRCPPPQGSLHQIDYPYDQYCAVSVFVSWSTEGDWNFTRFEEDVGKDPVDTLRGCCPSPDENVLFMGDENCTAVCKMATVEERETAKDCLGGTGPHTGAWICAGDTGNGGGRTLAIPEAVGWSGYLVLGLLASYLVRGI